MEQRARLQAENKYLQGWNKSELQFWRDCRQEQKKKISSHYFITEQVAANWRCSFNPGRIQARRNLFARAVHTSATEEKRPLVKVTVQRIPVNLMREVKLAGREKGIHWCDG